MWTKWRIYGIFIKLKTNLDWREVIMKLKLPQWTLNPTWLPNALTLSRWLVAPPILLFGLSGYWWLATGLLYWAVFADMIDGILARKLGVASNFGVALDRYGDTLLMTLATTGLILTHRTPFWIGLFIFGLASLVLLEAGKRFLPVKSWPQIFSSQTLRLYYIFVSAALMILYWLVAGGSVWLLIILAFIIAGVGLYVKRDRIKTF
jgi:phosphatidylglycerophosphate synthase